MKLRKLILSVKDTSEKVLSILKLFATFEVYFTWYISKKKSIVPRTNNLIFRYTGATYFFSFCFQGTQHGVIKLF